MFYCEKCRHDAGWPESVRTSFGPCEMCGRVKECHDRPSSSLPLPKRRRAKKLNKPKRLPKR